MHEQQHYTPAGGGGYGPRFSGERRRISWGAIFAGTVAALSVQMVLTLLGLSIGLWVIDPAAGQPGFEGLGIGAAIWAIVSFVIALYCGGWIAGRMSGLGSKMDGMLEGFVVWGTVTVVAFFLLTTAIGGIVGGAAGLAGQAMAAAEVEVEEIPEAWQEFGAPAREEDEAAEMPDEVEEMAEEVGEEAAEAGAAASLWAFLSLLLGAIAATLAGRQGSASALRELREETAPAGPAAPERAPEKK